MHNFFNGIRPINMIFNLNEVKLITVFDYLVLETRKTVAGIIHFNIIGDVAATSYRG